MNRSADGEALRRFRRGSIVRPDGIAINNRRVRDVIQTTRPVNLIKRIVHVKHLEVYHNASKRRLEEQCIIEDGDGLVRSACTVPDWAEAWRNRDRCPWCGDDFNHLGRCTSCFLDPDGAENRSYQRSIRSFYPADRPKTVTVVYDYDAHCVLLYPGVTASRILYQIGVSGRLATCHGQLFSNHHNVHAVVDDDTTLFVVPAHHSELRLHASPIAVNVTRVLYIVPGATPNDVLAELELEAEYSLVDGEGVPFTGNQDIHAAYLEGEEFFAVCKQG